MRYVTNESVVLTIFCSCVATGSDSVMWTCVCLLDIILVAAIVYSQHSFVSCQEHCPQGQEIVAQISRRLQTRHLHQTTRKRSELSTVFVLSICRRTSGESRRQRQIGSDHGHARSNRRVGNSQDYQQVVFSVGRRSCGNETNVSEECVAKNNRLRAQRHTSTMNYPDRKSSWRFSTFLF